MGIAFRSLRGNGDEPAYPADETGWCCDDLYRFMPTRLRQLVAADAEVTCPKSDREPTDAEFTQRALLADELDRDRAARFLGLSRA